MQRRKFLQVASSTAIAWSLPASAQQSDRQRRVGAHMNLAERDPEAPQYIAALAQGLAEKGWIVGRNVQIDYRWTGGDAERVRRTAQELVQLKPDVILTVGASQVGPLQQLTREIPIVFVQVADPVGAGFVSSLSRPGGNSTGFVVFEYSIGAKWLELLKQFAPRVARIAVLRDPANPSGPALFAVVQAVASSLNVEVRALGLRNPSELENDIGAFAARRSDGGLIITPTSLAIANRELITSLAARHGLPSIYPFRYFFASGGFLYYGPSVPGQYRQAAGYIDRILRGEKPADLPVQTPEKYDLGVNLKTAKALGLDIPQPLLARADEVIE